MKPVFGERFKYIHKEIEKVKNKTNTLTWGQIPPTHLKKKRKQRKMQNSIK